MQLPSKKIILVVLACSIAGSTVAYAANYKAAARPDTRLILEEKASTPIATHDDWKTTLAVIQPALTNGLGTSTTKLATSTGPETITGDLGKEVISYYLESRENGGTLTPDLQDQIVQHIASDSQTANVQFAPKTYINTDIQTGSDDSPAAIHAYGNALAEALINNTPSDKNTSNELAIYMQAVSDNNANDLLPLASIIVSYQKTIVALLKMHVPPSAASFHLALINAYSTIETIDGGLQKLFSDPVTSLYAFKQYEDQSVVFYQAVTNFSIYFKSHNVGFSPNEPGYKVSQ